ncbi:hypothetical protein L1F30_13240 [Simiduia sp. 21SJ11W-1]|uniref:hypothetical protein n=1 Tax=Simiduia sp. 21SJ11W-1 TaxID=2909669 RepID=UPI00209DFB48|nr:hypothetical protein [Simiduia sp. 21SJ11W-1]UTA47121.1 hypothetical protein L1F30_13240 [Simiduia sp. 21SJ11W-1]
MKNVFALLVTAALFSGATFACDKPAAPELPDPASAVTAQMIKAKNDVKAYLDAANSYIECVKGNASRHNAMIGEMETVAANFNEAVRAYKERMTAG